MVLETLVLSSLNRLARLVAREYFINGYTASPCSPMENKMCHRRRRILWAHSMFMRKPHFRMFSHLYLDFLEHLTKFYQYFLMSIQWLNTLLLFFGNEVEKENINFR
jgi:hypothetical protein